MRRLARPGMYGGVASIILGLGKYHAATAGDYDFTTSSRFGWAFAYIGMLCVAGYAVGLPEVPRSTRSRLLSAASASALGALSMSVLQLFAGDSLLPRFVVFGGALVAVPWTYAMSSLAGAGRSTLERRDRVMVIGPPELASELSVQLSADPEKPASVVAQLSEDDVTRTVDGESAIVDAVKRASATVIVLSAAAQSCEPVIRQVAALHERGVRVRTHSLFYEEWLGKIPVADLGRVSLFFDIGEVHRDRFSRSKRLVDIAAGGLGCLVLVVAVPVVLFGNGFGNRGPLLYSQERVGRRGKVFRIYKFRSMHAGTATTTTWTTSDDPRITRFGRVLRMSHLDELPQVWNILRGDLSLVGPRPEQPHYVETLTEWLPFYDLRHIVRPGLTGWAQVKYGYAGDERDALEKLQYDFHYLRRQSLLFDMRIVGRTLRSAVGVQGRGR